jgi:hypothetical protein
MLLFQQELVFKAHLHVEWLERMLLFQQELVFKARNYEEWLEHDFKVRNHEDDDNNFITQNKL